MNLSGKTVVYGVIGDPVEHTLSPAIQNAAFETLDMNCIFIAFRVSLGKVKEALEGMKAFYIHGLNITMPLKSAVIPYLDEIDESAKILSSVNTILNNNGKLRGFSTDGAGALKALRENGIPLSGKKVLMLGGGGAARAIAFTLVKEVDKLIILNRTAEKSRILVDGINRHFQKDAISGGLTPDLLKTCLKEVDILINATSLGMNQNTNSVKPEWLGPNLTVMDIVYSPLKTKLLQAAVLAGAQTINGLEMLIYQGAASFEIWTGKPAPVEVMRQAALKQIANSR